MKTNYVFIPVMSAILTLLITEGIMYGVPDIQEHFAVAVIVGILVTGLMVGIFYKEKL